MVHISWSLFNKDLWSIHSCKVSYGRRNLAGYSPWGQKKSRTWLSDEHFHFQMSKSYKQMINYNKIKNDNTTITQISEGSGDLSLTDAEIARN